MTPRNPDESSRNDVQDEILQTLHDAMNEAPADDGAHSPAPAQAPAPSTQVEGMEIINEAVELDRLAIYLKGPTAFTA